MKPKEAECVALREEKTKKGRLIMKKMILLLAVMLMTAPAMAAVTITVTDDGDGWAVISYDATTETDFVRAFALDITASNDVNIVAYDSADANYWVYPGTIDINDAGGVNDVGTPIAPNGSPGALGGLGTNGITIEMGALFEAGVDDPPAAEGVLLRIQLDPAATADAADVCVVGNAMRGNIVMKDASSQAIDPAACQVVVVGGGTPPTCWDITECAGQPSGDSTCDGSINFGDLFALKAAFGSTKAGGPPYNCCADFNQDESINFGDLFILKAGFGGSGYSPATLNQSCP